MYMAGDQLYYIWSFEHDGWVKPGHAGYIEDFHAAGKFTLKDANDIVLTKNAAFNGGYEADPQMALVPVAI